jgi:hypothetical protein
MTGDRLDACRDAGALIRAIAGNDTEATGVILDHSDNRQVCEILALIVVAACGAYGPGFLAELCAELRDLDQPEGLGHDRTPPRRRPRPRPGW